MKLYIHLIITGVSAVHDLSQKNTRSFVIKNTTIPINNVLVSIKWILKDKLLEGSTIEHS